MSRIRNFISNDKQRQNFVLTLFVVFTLAAVPESLLAVGEVVIHTQVISATENEDITIEASLEGVQTQLIEARVYYRSEDETAFKYEELRVDGYEISGNIPAEDVQQGKLEYYLSFIPEVGAPVTYPANSPETSALVIDVRTRRIGRQAIVILSPEPGSAISEDRAVIALSFMQDVRKMDPKSIRFFLDKADLTERAQISEDMLVLKVEGLRPGNHEAAVYITEGGKKEKLIGWSFQNPSRAVRQRAPGQVKGQVTGGYSHENITGLIRNITYLDARANGDLKKVKWAGKMYLTSQERGNLQPQNRFLASMKYGMLTLRLGDTNPRLSEYTLWGTRTRGVQFSLRSDYFNLDVVHGYTRRAVEAALDSIVVLDPVTGEPLQNSVGADSMTIDTDAGVYDRQLIGIKPGFPLAENVVWSFNFLKVKDIEESIEIDSLGRPKDNLVIGSDLKASFDNHRITFLFETAMSLYNNDISNGAMSDADFIENLIVINQNFEPLPSDQSIIDADLSSSELFSKLFKELRESSMALRTQVKLKYYMNELSLGYRSIGRSFKSLGSPTIPTDVKGFSIQDRFRILSNRVYLTVGYEGYQDNVNGRSEYTMDRNILRANVNYYSPPIFPNLSFGMGSYSRANDGIVDSIAVGDFIDVVDYRVDNETTNMNFSVDQSFRLGDYSNTAVFGYNMSNTKNNLVDTTDIDLSTMSLSLTSRRGPKIQGRIAYSATTQESFGGDYSTDYSNIALSGKYMLLPQMLWVNAGLGMTMTSGGNDYLTPEPPDADKPNVARSFTLDYNRTQLSVGSELRIGMNHNFRLLAYKVFYTDDGYYEYWDGTQVKNEDQPNFTSQDDFVTRLKYTYIF